MSSEPKNSNLIFMNIPKSQCQKVAKWKSNMFYTVINIWEDVAMESLRYLSLSNIFELKECNFRVKFRHRNPEKILSLKILLNSTYWKCLPRSYYGAHWIYFDYQFKICKTTYKILYNRSWVMKWTKNCCKVAF